MGLSAGRGGICRLRRRGGMQRVPSENALYRCMTLKEPTHLARDDGLTETERHPRIRNQRLREIPALKDRLEVSGLPACPVASHRRAHAWGGRRLE
jgi:hypothetical protein